MEQLDKSGTLQCLGPLNPLKYSKFDVDFRNALKNQERFAVFEIIAFEFHAANPPYIEANTCHWQSMC